MQTWADCESSLFLSFCLVLFTSVCVAVWFLPPVIHHILAPFFSPSASMYLFPLINILFCPFSVCICFLLHVCLRLVFSSHIVSISWGLWNEPLHSGSHLRSFTFILLSPSLPPRLYVTLYLLFCLFTAFLFVCPAILNYRGIFLTKTTQGHVYRDF